ncbi:TPA: hypothetical protein EYP66_00235, partial [Candidatus Poribacteria bacterium]|nr:hypothetical protein [Candidatus Poribacteria bacterium]
MELIMQEAQKIETNTNQNYIFPAKTGLISFRDAGYKDTSMAIAELIDNSIQATCKHIRVLAFEEVDHSGVRNTKQVKKLAVFDNGEGMSADVLAICLGFAQGTRLNKREGIGRFGVGLPLASISQCKKTTVYSWQKGGDVLSTYLDIQEVEDTDQQYTNPVTKSSIPKDIEQSLGDLIGETGTIVVWENCDRLDLKRPKTLLSRMERGFCRIYRHFLDDDDTYGKRVDIKLLSIAGTDIKETALLPNDPLYLMTPNNLPGYEKEATSVVHEKPIIRNIEYAPGQFSKIEIHSSIMRRDIGRWPNGKATEAIRQHYRANVGISFVRAEREIDFGVFNYFNPSELVERYWGIEIRFEPELDEVFGVTNNKQNVRGIELLDKEEEENYDEDLFKSDYKLQLRRVLSQDIVALHAGMKKEIGNMAPKDDGKGSNNWTTPGLGASKQASELLKGNPVKTGTKIEAKSKSDIEKQQEREDIIRSNDPSLSEKDVKIAAEGLEQLEVAIAF